MAIRRIKGVIFDMDGTLTIPTLDFHKMRELVGAPQDQDILVVVNSYPPEKREACLEIIHQLELEAAEAMKLQPTALELLQILQKHQIHHGIITRNSEVCLDHFLSKTGICSFNGTVSRDSPLPFKPSPEPVFHLLNRWDLQPHEVIFVGDGKDDILSGKSAGTLTCLKKNPKNHSFESEADFSVETLIDLLKHVQISNS
mmetsp:Transcript_29896/g.41322  ORF Transcript_29896/g.41322 Transcript_29896/m.41322 type:complete len:200 (-) Transcript_29896:44-643(-)|eukprot:CAMPEP_0201490490 /NCGR_PEP_ID=MMETSP0151_2-20130828/26583_1 /ASSEMBLY_ACC=CAM_ASM_000257 /TAXON_ID=200890 /ORGANISM="Paramoeba atlantica, Strain 621/1 / CCAP 1560/9" /LENGTH=199 /DNA_ID=CAMNT_0047876463 /DNA_START=85 /DNA_END=684 /DNA_ORIENTATION=+